MHRESQEINDPAWDCTLIKTMKEHKDTVVNAIYEWSDRDVWDFIKDRGIEINPLYDMGFRRVGCVGCPLATKAEKQKEFELFPTYKKAYINAFQKVVDMRGLSNSSGKWTSGEAMFNWWTEADEQIEGQISMFEEDKA